MVSVASFSEVGGHAVNEDAFAVRQHPSAPHCWLCMLADGQGGQAGGGRAARLACDAALSSALRLSPHALAEPGAWDAVLRSADEAVRADPQAGFTTLVGFCLVGGRVAAVCGASSGDSALLVLSEDRFDAPTRHQHKNPPVGSGAAVFVPFEAALSPPWTALAMSDGVWKYVGWEKVGEAARAHRGQALIDALAALARLPGSGQFQDDFTAVALHDAAPLGAPKDESAEPSP
jgi:hypothetical protein